MQITGYRVETWLNPRLEPRPSPIQGKGFFAREPIAVGNVVSIVGGALLTEAEFQAFQATTPMYNAIQIDEDLHLVERQEITRATDGSMNHSCDANVWMADSVTLVARRDIAADEEITVDYALFTVQPQWTLEPACACGSPLCRGRVTGNDWQLPAVQAQYAGHFSPFLNRRIARQPVWH